MKLLTAQGLHGVYIRGAGNPSIGISRWDINFTVADHLGSGRSTSCSSRGAEAQMRIGTPSFGSIDKVQQPPDT